MSGQVRWLQSVSEWHSINQHSWLHSRRNSSFSRSWYTMYLMFLVPNTWKEVHMQNRLQEENEAKDLHFKDANAVVLPSSTRCQGCETSQGETFITQSPAVFWGQTCNWKTTTNVQAPPSYRDLNLDATACFIRSKSLENRLGRKITLENKLHFVLCFCYSKSTRILGIETMISSYLSNRISTEKISTRWPLLWCLYLGGH